MKGYELSREIALKNNHYYYYYYYNMILYSSPLIPVNSGVLWGLVIDPIIFLFVLSLCIQLLIKMLSHIINFLLTCNYRSLLTIKYPRYFTLGNYL